MQALSKSTILAFRQCAKKLWLRIHRPSLSDESGETNSRFETGREVEAIARSIFDPKGKGYLVDSRNIETALAQSTKTLTSSRPIFEAGFSAKGALAFVDILLPITKSKGNAWRMIEVKSSTGVKDHYRDDAAIQAFVVKSSGVPVDAISITYVDSQWVYPGGGDYQGLLVESDLTEEAFSRFDEVNKWVKEAHNVANLPNEPAIKTGRHCNTPYSCGFADYCRQKEPQTKYPVDWLPRIQSKPLKS